MTSIESLPGVGPQLATAIRRAFDGDDAFLRAARAMDLQAIEAVEGISPKRALDLVRHVTGQGGAEDFLATPAARKVHDEVQRRLLRFATTEHGRNRLRLLAPLATQDQAIQRMQHILAQKARVAAWDREAIRRAMRRLRPLQQPPAVCDTTTLLVASDDETYEHLHGLGAGRWCYLAPPREGAASDAELIVVAGDLDLPADLQVPENAKLWEAAPQALLAWARINHPVLQACADLAQQTGAHSVAGKLLELPTPEEGGFDERALRDAISEVQKDSDQRLEQELAGLALPATDLMRAMAANTPPPAIRSVLDDVLQEAATRVKAMTGWHLRPFLPQFPLEVDEDELNRVIEEQRSRSRAEQFAAAQRIARVIAENQEALAAEVATWLEQDADFALGCFALHHDLQEARFGASFSFDASIHLALADQSDAQRIAYRLGDAHPLVVLTGANSGGKSTLLEHLAQLALMARMGLPVVGEGVTVPWVDELHFVTARRGLDAGAFETFLRTFLPIAQGDARRLVLADEVESVTELEAAGRILGFFLDRLAATDSLCVLVTHMADAILSHVRAPVRVDGIDAVGLDEHDRLVVDRCPKMGHVARSTPELIVQRLAATAKGDDRTLFQALHQAMTDPETRK